MTEAASDGAQGASAIKRGVPVNWHAKAARFGNAEAWHKLRRKHIGGTEQAALWNESPYMTALKVYHVKKGNLEDDFEENERMTIGKHIEPAIASAALQLHQRVGMAWTGGYLKHPTIKGMGATLDWIIWEPGVGYVPLEIKNVDGMQWALKWALGDGAFEPPLHIDLQVQHQIAVTGAPLGYIAVLVGGSQIKLLSRPAMPDVQALMAQKVTKFWDDFKANIEPELVLTKDFETLSRVRTNVREGASDRSADPEFASLVTQYAAAKAQENAAKAALERIKAEALLMAGEDTELVAEIGRVTAKLAPPRAARLVEYAAQPARREIRFYPKKERKGRNGPDASGDE